MFSLNNLISAASWPLIVHITTLILRLLSCLRGHHLSLLIQTKTSDPCFNSTVCLGVTSLCLHAVLYDSFINVATQITGTKGSGLSLVTPLA